MRKNINYMKVFSKYLKKVKIYTCIIMLFALVLATLSLIFPWVWANAISSMVNVTNQTYLTLIKYIIVLIVLELIEGLLNLIKNIVYSIIEYDVTEEIKKDLFKKILTLETRAFDRNRITYFAKKLTDEPHILVSSFVKIMYGVINILKILVVIILAYKMCPDVGIIFTVVSLVIYFTIKNLRPFIIKNERVIGNYVKNYTNSLYDILRQMREIKVLGVKEQVRKNFNMNNTDVVEKINTLRSTDNLMQLLMFTIRFSLHSLVLIVGTYYLYSKVIDFKTVIILEIYSNTLFVAVNQMLELSELILVFKNSLKSIFDVITNKVYDSEKYGKIENIEGAGNLIVKNLGFSITGKKMIIDNLSFEVQAGTKVAIVDKGGNSKQILSDILLRHYEPIEGRIMIDDINIKDLSEKGFRKCIMHIGQSPFIFDDTLENNLRIVSDDVTTNEIIDVCKKAGIFKWFDCSSLNDVLKTRLGQSGFILTDTQRQQIAIARAMLVKPKIIILDELVSDMSTDEAFTIKKVLDEISESTILILSERISSISVCDEIITLENTDIAGITVQRDTIRDRRNIYSKFAQVELDKKNKDKLKEPKIEDSICTTGVEDITKLNIQKGAKDGEHCIFSQIW